MLEVKTSRKKNESRVATFISHIRAGFGQRVGINAGKITSIYHESNELFSFLSAKIVANGLDVLGTLQVHNRL